VVAASIHQEMAILGAASVYLDLHSYLPRADILAHFPNIYQKCLDYGVDITREPAPVAPAAHYACGGVAVDAWGRTGLAHLYAVGEAACTGVHGANRLASTSLLEGLVWGYRAAACIRRAANGNGRLGPDPAGLRSYHNDLAGQPGPDPAEIERYTQAIRNLMWEQVGLVRTTACLEYALARLGQWQQEIEQIYQNSRPTDALIGLRNLVQVARLITAAALKNEVRAGCHYRM
jgi:L-aspartate oxidase